MVKSFKYFRIQFGSNSTLMKMNDKGKPVYKYSMYMQSRDNAWINRNTKDRDEDIESTEQEIQDD